MSLITATVRRPTCVPMSTIVFASPRAASSVFMKAPEPVFTSRTMASLPPAIFLLITLAAMSGTLSTVAVTSRRAYSFLSAGTRSAVCPAIAHPMWLTCSMNWSAESSVRNPGMASSLSMVPPVWPSPRPDSFATGAPQAATRGMRTSEVLSPTPPVLCLSTFTPRIALRSSCAPERTIAMVNSAVSSGVMPRKNTAIRKALI